MIPIETILQDLRYGARVLRRNVGFTAVAVLTLAVGIGVNTAVFTSYQAMLARPLAARDASEMANVALIRESGGADFAFSYPDYEVYRNSARTFSGLVAFGAEQLRLSDAGKVISQRTSVAASAVGRLGLLSSGASNAEFASVFAVSENYFQVLGATAVSGRTFESRGAELSKSPSVLVSENYWERRFSKDASLLGRTIRLNGTAVTVIGITPRDFVGTFIAVPDFWLPMSLEPLIHGDENWLRDRENRHYRLFGRLAAGASMRQAQAEMNVLLDHVRGLHDPHSDSGKPATALVWPGSPFPLPLYLYPGLSLTIALIMIAAAMVLVVACATVGSLQLARARSRENELRTRQSLGAAQARIVRQLLTESALVGLLAGIAALFFSWALLRVAATLVAEALPAQYGTLVFNVNPDLGIFAYVFGISLLSGILFGLAPALESSRSLASGARSSTASKSSRRLQDFLVAAQVTLSVVLLTAGSMLVRSSVRALNMPTGYDSKRVLDLNFEFPENSKYTVARKLALTRELRSRLSDLPDVSAITSARPPDDSRFRTAASTEERESLVYYSYVQPNYFDALGIALSPKNSVQSARQSVILSESAARVLWPGQNPIGHSVRLGPIDERFHDLSELVADGPTYLVAGVARDTRGVEFDGSDSKKVYLSLPEDRLWDRPILIRTRTDAARVVRAIDSLISSVDPDLLGTSSTLDENLRRTAPFIISSLAAAIASTVGALGLLLALTGIYGTVSYIVVLRTREVGIRMAIGAQKRDILRLMLTESTRPVLAGLLLGTFLAMAASFVLRRSIHALNPVDGVSLMGTTLFFLVVALLASYPPARRALSVDPTVALRYE